MASYRKAAGNSTGYSVFYRMAVHVYRMVGRGDFRSGWSVGVVWEAKGDGDGPNDVLGNGKSDEGRVHAMG